MSVINTNVNAIIAQNAGVKNSRMQTQAMQQLSTGNRINSAADDAAGLAISSKMTAQIRGLNQAVRNANDGISLIQTAEGALTEVNNMLQRMRELAVQSASDTNTSSDRTALNAEFSALRDEINRIGSNTQFNGMNVLDGSFTGNGATNPGKFIFQVGANAAQTIDITLGDFRTTSGATGVHPVKSTNLTVGTTGFNEGDDFTITLGGTSQFQYAVTAEDEAAADAIAAAGGDEAAYWAGKIASANTLSNYTITANGANLEITSTGFTDFAVSITENGATGVMTADTVTSVEAVQETGGGTPQQSTLTLSGEFREGDVISFTPDNAGDGAVDPILYTVTADDVGGTVAATRTNVAAKLAALNFDGFTMSADAGVISITGTGSDAFTASLSATLPTTYSANTFNFDNFVAGDKITVTKGSASYEYVVTAAAAATDATFADEMETAFTTAMVAAGGIADTTGVVTWVAAPDSVTVTRANGATDGSVVANPGQTQYDTVDYVAATSGGGTNTAGLAMINSSNINDQASANAAVTAVDSAIAVVSGGRATMGATINRLNYAADNLLATSANVSASRSRIQDTDYSQATTELARTQIIQQASTAMLAQANQSAQSVLSLLK